MSRNERWKLTGGVLEQSPALTEGTVPGWVWITAQGVKAQQIGRQKAPALSLESLLATERSISM